MAEPLSPCGLHSGLFHGLMISEFQESQALCACLLASHILVLRAKASHMPNQGERYGSLGAIEDFLVLPLPGIDSFIS